MPEQIERLEYLPWSGLVLRSALSTLKDGRVPSVDFETSAVCVHSRCIYCDSNCSRPLPDEVAAETAVALLNKAADAGADWLYLCGLGEPTDDPKFPVLLDTAASRGMGVSMFTNGIHLTERVVRLIIEHRVCLIMKFDSIDCDVFDRLLGRRGSAAMIRRNLDTLLSSGYGSPDRENRTRLAASIVPTTVNLHTISATVQFCVDNGVFPSIGELEFAGRARGIYASLHVPTQDLRSLKRDVDAIVGYPYERPMCPAALTGLHIDNYGNYIVDRCTGLSCQWFLLRGPDCVNLGPAADTEPLDVLQKVIAYRRERLLPPHGQVECPPDVVFGGCGGRADRLLQEHLALLADMP